MKIEIIYITDSYFFYFVTLHELPTFLKVGLKIIYTLYKLYMFYKIIVKFIELKNLILDFLG